MKVKATKKGYDGIAVREPGDVFDMPETTIVKGKDEDGNAVETEIPLTSTWYASVDAEGDAPKGKGKAKDKSLA